MHPDKPIRAPKSNPFVPLVLSLVRSLEFKACPSIAFPSAGANCTPRLILTPLKQFARLPPTFSCSLKSLSIGLLEFLSCSSHSPFQAVCSLLKLSNPFRVVCSRRFLKFLVAFERLCWFLICCHPCFLCSQTLSTCLSALLLHLEFYSTFRVACSYFSNALIHVAQLSPLSLILLSFTTRTGDASPNLVSPVHFA